MALGSNLPVATACTIACVPPSSKAPPMASLAVSCVMRPALKSCNALMVLSSRTPATANVVAPDNHAALSANLLDSVMDLPDSNAAALVSFHAKPMVSKPSVRSDAAAFPTRTAPNAKSAGPSCSASVAIQSPMAPGLVSADLPAVISLSPQLD